MQERELEQSIDRQRRATSSFLRSELEFHRLLEKLPAGAYTCDPEGLITYYNQQAVKVWGRAPKLNDAVDRFCGSFKLFSTNGSPIAHDECWMALALRTAKEYNGQEIVIEPPMAIVSPPTQRGDQIRLSAEQQGNSVAITVQDSGIGIPSEMMPRIFEMFMQVDQSLDRAHGGLGIGLTLVKRLVEMHGGSIEAHSSGIGKGSEFTVRLPVLVEAVAAA